MGDVDTPEAAVIDSGGTIHDAAAYQAAVAAVPAAHTYADPYAAQTPEPMHHAPATYVEPEVKTGLLARMPSLIKRAETVVQEMPERLHHKAPFHRRSE